MFKLQSYPPAEGVEENTVVRWLVGACGLQSISGTFAWRLMRSRLQYVGCWYWHAFTGGLMRFEQHQICVGLPLKQLTSPNTWQMVNFQTLQLFFYSKYPEPCWVAVSKK